jgi:hypothetical protein
MQPILQDVGFFWHSFAGIIHEINSFPADILGFCFSKGSNRFQAGGKYLIQ